MIVVTDGVHILFHFNIVLLTLGCPLPRSFVLIEPFCAGIKCPVWCAGQHNLNLSYIRKATKYLSSASDFRHFERHSL